MQYRNMGRTGLQLSVLSFGSWVSFHKQIDDAIADELMELRMIMESIFLTMPKCMRWEKVKK